MRRIIILLISLCTVLAACSDIESNSTTSPQHRQEQQSTEPFAEDVDITDYQNEPTSRQLSPEERIVGRWRVVSFSMSPYTMMIDTDDILLQQAEDYFSGYGEFLFAIWEFLPNGEFKKHFPSFLESQLEEQYSTGNWEYLGEEEYGDHRFSLYFRLVHYDDYYLVPYFYLYDDKLLLEDISDGGSFMLDFEREQPAVGRQDVVGIWELHTVTSEGITEYAKEAIVFEDGFSDWSWSVVFLPDGRTMPSGTFGVSGKWRETGRNGHGNLVFEVEDELGLSFYELTQSGELVMTSEYYQEFGDDYFTFRREW